MRIWKLVDGKSRRRTVHERLLYLSRPPLTAHRSPLTIRHLDPAATGPSRRRPKSDIGAVVNDSDASGLPSQVRSGRDHESGLGECVCDVLDVHGWHGVLYRARYPVRHSKEHSVRHLQSTRPSWILVNTDGYAGPTVETRAPPASGNEHTPPSGESHGKAHDAVMTTTTTMMMAMIQYLMDDG